MLWLSEKLCGKSCLFVMKLLKKIFIIDFSSSDHMMVTITIEAIHEINLWMTIKCDKHLRICMTLWSCKTSQDLCEINDFE